MRILVSACLLGSPCKYNGGDNLCPRLLELAQDHTLIPLCPEQLGGLPTPRPPAERKDSCVITQSGKDVTEFYQKGASEVARLARLLGAEAAVLKARSPACGCGSIYDGTFTHPGCEKWPCGRSAAGSWHPSLHGRTYSELFFRRGFPHA